MAATPVVSPRLLTLARDLRRRKARERADVFVAEGIRTVEALLASPLAVQGVLVSPALAETPRGVALRAALEERGVTITEVSAKDFATACDTDTPQGVLAVADIPTRGWGDLEDVREGRLRTAPTTTLRLLLLDGVQDPGNVGTIIRTAAALGATATVAMPGTVDLWNAKVVRSAMGALFSHLVFSSDWDAFDRYRAESTGEQRIATWGTDASGDALPGIETIPPRLAIIMGNEGAGLSAPARSRADHTVSLPIAGVESLNVAVAAGIFLYEMWASSHPHP